MAICLWIGINGDLSDRCLDRPKDRHDHWFKCGLPGPSWLGKLARLTESGLAMTVPKERRKAVPYYGAVIGGQDGKINYSVIARGLVTVAI